MFDDGKWKQQSQRSEDVVDPRTIAVWRGLEVLSGAMSEWREATGADVFETPWLGSRDPVWRAERIRSDTQLTWFPNAECRATYLAASLGLPYDSVRLEWMQGSLTPTRGGPIVLVQRFGAHGREVDLTLRDALDLERNAREIAALMRSNIRRAA